MPDSPQELGDRTLHDCRMRLARFWTRAQAQSVSRKGKVFKVSARGWSDDSVEAAYQCALDLASKVADRVASGLTTKHRYPYAEKPLPEPVVQRLGADGGGASAIVTRNAYGALVLNTDQLMFVDIDRPGYQGSAPTLGTIFSSLFSKPKAQEQPADDAATLDAVKNVVQRHDLSARVYETAGGHRLIVTNAPFKAGDPDAESLLAEFGSDPLYVRLCRSQDSFRARLTPKPWRCRMSNPPVEFPFETPQVQERYDRWLAGYEAKIALLATCRFVKTIGVESVAPGFDELIRYHDEQTKATSGLKLA